MKIKYIYKKYIIKNLKTQIIIYRYNIKIKKIYLYIYLYNLIKIQIKKYMTHKYTFSFLSITSDKEKCIDQLPDIPALHRTSQGRCRTSQVPDIPALRRTSQGRCRTSRPCAGHLKAGAGYLKTGTGYPGQALDFLMNSIKDHKSSPQSKSLTLPVAN